MYIGRGRIIDLAQDGVRERPIWTGCIIRVIRPCKYKIAFKELNYSYTFRIQHSIELDKKRLYLSFLKKSSDFKLLCHEFIENIYEDVTGHKIDILDLIRREQWIKKRH